MPPSSPITEEALVDFIESVGIVTFVDIMQHFGSAAQGSHVLTWNGDPHLIVWDQVSQSLQSAIAAAITHRQIYGEDAEPDIYLGNGLLSRFSLAKTLTLHHYKTPHWVPVCLSIWRFSDKPMTTI